ncbi:hypothetical protein BS47DRAFT_1297498, partial [Hydnum rufescens UP504]
DAFPGRLKWSPNQISDLSNKVFLITGMNTGISVSIWTLDCLDLLTHNAKVYIAGCSAERVTEAIQDLKKTTGKGDDSIKFLKLDLADLKSVKTAVDEFLLLMIFFHCGLSRKVSRLDVLINNAGVAQGVRSKLDQITPAGLNLEFAVNMLGHFYLTHGPFIFPQPYITSGR